MTETPALQISVQLTPNPNSLQFCTNRELVQGGSYNSPDAESAKGSPLAETLFNLGSVSGVLIGRDFVTVTKKPDQEWSVIAGSISEILNKRLGSSEKLVDDAVVKKSDSPISETEMQIRRVIDEEIRPAVARDGGDIIFDSYEDGIVRLRLQGACSSCPSSIMTLKMGIENRLKQVIPEIREVVSV